MHLDNYLVPLSHFAREFVFQILSFCVFIIFKSNDLYFLTSVDKIRPFLEKDGLKILQQAKENESEPKLKQSEKNIFNKIGHALHALNPTFKEITFGQNVKVC